MKIKVFLVAVLVLCALFSLTAFAEEKTAEDFYNEQYKNSGADKISDALPSETQEFFNKNGIDPSDYNWVNSITAESAFSHIWGFIKSGATAPMKAGAAIIAIILISAALASVEIKSSAVTAANYAATAAAAAVIAIPVSSVIESSVNAMKGMSSFMLSFIPVFAVIVSATGAVATSVSMNGLLLLASQGVTYISNHLVLPLMGGYLSISVGSSISPIFKKTGIAETVKKIAMWIMALVSTIYLGILGIQTAVNSSADTLVSKTTKFIIGTGVPVAGGALSEALGTVRASMGILKSSVGIYGAVACAIILLPFLAELLIWRLVLLVCSIISEIFALSEISALLKAVDAMLSLLLGIIFLSGAIFIISLAAVTSGVKTV